MYAQGLAKNVLNHIGGIGGLIQSDLTAFAKGIENAQLNGIQREPILSVSTPLNLLAPTARSGRIMSMLPSRGGRIGKIGKQLLDQLPHPPIPPMFKAVAMDFMNTGTGAHNLFLHNQVENLLENSENHDDGLTITQPVDSSIDEEESMGQDDDSWGCLGWYNQLEKPSQIEAVLADVNLCNSQMGLGVCPQELTRDQCLQMSSIFLYAQTGVVHAQDVIIKYKEVQPLVTPIMDEGQCHLLWKGDSAADDLSTHMITDDWEVTSCRYSAFHE
eukprot:GHVH01004320.1.p1 GENE.GHVH01004320.1~~GHVH01004320.1.p1  ORF type:complete len:273 (+),score=36.52 GHVH01004320.1:730-1548(+)